MYDKKDWTYGAEHELVDWDIRSELPASIIRDHDDYTMVNSNGIANDPTGKLCFFGGEVNTIPTNTAEEQVQAVTDIKAKLANVKVNYRSNLHLHIRVPGLKDDLVMLQHIQRRTSQFIEPILDLIDPIRPNVASKIASKRLKHSLRSRHTMVKGVRLEEQLAATTLEDFFNAEAPKDKKGKPQFQLVSRAAINLRSLLDNNTVEFRHWAGTLDESKIRNAFAACEAILSFLMGDEPTAEQLMVYLATLDLPRQMAVDDFLEQSYAMTSGHKVGREVAAANIKLILGEA